MAFGPETPFIDPLVSLAAVAAATKTLRLGTGVNILPQTNPLLLAKQAASLNAVSNGRFMLGVGIGWLREEYDAMGTPFARRGARFDEYVAAMRKVWSGEVVEHQGEFLSWSGFKSYPSPRQNPLPVIIGGSKGKVCQRIARHGNGWFHVDSGADVLLGQLAELRVVCEQENRDPAEFEITCMWSGKGGVAEAQALEDLGVHRAVVPLMSQGMELIELIQTFGEEIVARA